MGNTQAKTPRQSSLEVISQDVLRGKKVIWFAIILVEGFEISLDLQRRNAVKSRRYNIQ